MNQLFHLSKRVLVASFPTRFTFELIETGQKFGSYTQAWDWIERNRIKLNLPLSTSAVEIYEE